MKKGRRALFIFEGVPTLVTTEIPPDDGSGVPASNPGANLAKGWEEPDERVEAKAFADRELYRLLNEATSNWSRLFLYHVVLELGRKFATLATLEEVRALVIEFKEYVP